LAGVKIAGVNFAHINSEIQWGQNNGMAKDNNYVPVWFWMLAMFVTAIPCVGLVMIIVWAFWGENESRKNYFRALILWFLIWTLIVLGLMCLGLMPAIMDELKHWHWKH
jgi:hypothetical protein